jgi:hypothetical protein
MDLFVERTVAYVGKMRVSRIDKVQDQEHLNKSMVYLDEVD